MEIIPLGALTCEYVAYSWFTRTPKRYYILLVQSFEYGSLGRGTDDNPPLEQRSPLQCQRQAAENAPVKNFGPVFKIMCKASGLGFHGTLAVCRQNDKAPGLAQVGVGNYHCREPLLVLGTSSDDSIAGGKGV